MGAVYVAEQLVWRKVALKIIKPGMDTRQVIARFEADRPALALTAPGYAGRGPMRRRNGLRVTAFRNRTTSYFSTSQRLRALNPNEP